MKQRRDEAKSVRALKMKGNMKNKGMKVNCVYLTASTAYILMYFLLLCTKDTEFDSHF